MDKEKSGIGLIILGNVLYILYSFFKGKEFSAFGDFTLGLLLGLSIGINLIGIILVVLDISSDKNDKKMKNL